MITKRSLLVTLLISFLLCSSLFIFGCGKEKLPDNFAINIYSDMTSSGATREVTASLVFNEGNIVEGYAKRYFSDSTQDITKECVVDIATMKWVNATMESEDVITIPDPLQNCEIKFIQEHLEDGSFTDPEAPPLTKDGIQKLIDNKIMTLATGENPYCHYSICYTLELLS